MVHSRKRVKVQKRRLTIIINKNLERKLRDIQGHLIMRGNKAWSLSAIFTCMILVGLVGSSKLGKKDWKKIKLLLQNKMDLKRYPVTEFIENFLEI